MFFLNKLRVTLFSNVGLPHQKGEALGVSLLWLSIHESTDLSPSGGIFARIDQMSEVRALDLHCPFW